MGLRLTASVHFADSETGETRVVPLGEKLSAADRKALEKGGWKNRLGEITEDDGEGDVAELSLDELPENAGAPADTALPATDKPAPGVKESVAANQAVREGDQNDPATSGAGQGAARAKR